MQLEMQKKPRHVAVRIRNPALFSRPSRLRPTLLHNEEAVRLLLKHRQTFPCNFLETIFMDRESSSRLALLVHRSSRTGRLAAKSLKPEDKTEAARVFDWFIGGGSRDQSERCGTILRRTCRSGLSVGEFKLMLFHGQYISLDTRAVQRYKGSDTFLRVVVTGAEEGEKSEVKLERVYISEETRCESIVAPGSTSELEIVETARKVFTTLGASVPGRILGVTFLFLAAVRHGVWLSEVESCEFLPREAKATAVEPGEKVPNTAGKEKEEDDEDYKRSHLIAESFLKQYERQGANSEPQPGSRAHRYVVSLLRRRQSEQRPQREENEYSDMRKSLQSWTHRRTGRPSTSEYFSRGNSRNRRTGFVSLSSRKQGMWSNAGLARMNSEQVSGAKADNHKSVGTEKWPELSVRGVGRRSLLSL